MGYPGIDRVRGIFIRKYVWISLRDWSKLMGYQGRDRLNKRASENFFQALLVYYQLPIRLKMVT